MHRVFFEFSSQLSQAVTAFMQQELLVLHTILFVETIDVRLAKAVLHTIINKQLLASSEFSESNHLQRLLLPAVHSAFCSCRSTFCSGLP